MCCNTINYYKTICISERIERRKLKTFFKLTKTNEFEYTVGAYINLNMSLPLSYINFCITYVIIIIQFSKFID